MTPFYLALALLLLLSLTAGLWRILRGPTPADRMLAAQLFGTTAVAVLLLLAEATDQAAARDVALVFALLAAVTMVAFVRRGWTARPGEPPDDG
ncbi:MAG: pH regulation protein F [Gammaproteobacteria bacterium]|jgi:multicomponent Na+:H+ antiporter subunit F|nr:monovalent cation/H+ antiporter complex subunit F [Candidatus Thioaporhodococcus sediminis]TNF53691.1 MAG: pH regulation protein F [Gammaproteobacteria bacterium]